ncbi:MAG TPA: hypothetical protein VEQ66_06250, partial [Propionibacteriaceae bacterium]|nr:hypothetical protein [Propionibacteriaceae bacterium]
MSMQPNMTSILEQLAAGRIDAAEAARQIDALRASETADETPVATVPDEPVVEPSNEELAAAAETVESDGRDAWAAATDRPQQATYTTESFPSASSAPAPEPEESPASEPEAAEEPAHPKPVNTGGVNRISVRAVGRRVRIVGESSVATLSADGPHVLRRNGSVLEVSSEGEMGASLDGFSILRAPRNLDDIRSLGLGKELFLRVNPSLVVDVEVTAGSLHTEGVSHLGRIRVTAGGAKLLDVGEINDALVQAGQATIKGSITTGRSRVRAESGSLIIQLGDDSNVTIYGESQRGRVS